ncbi:hypothetical protein BCR44DRAFT_1272818 [Catenaria anguillulae PL171]|uniref:Uncharacterized protein n=1 Tax=Catenaria anguillulae PL171 TaxID=765915 RepID=A0A1Y2HA44_9FUNG|nr:hypothetical protein BCR44DRAFT_1272818 [Catenaria anguillulae PL171]
MLFIASCHSSSIPLCRFLSRTCIPVLLLHHCRFFPSDPSRIHLPKTIHPSKYPPRQALPLHLTYQRPMMMMRFFRFESSSLIVTLLCQFSHLWPRSTGLCSHQCRICTKRTHACAT